jgi:hypothetical protein
MTGRQGTGTVVNVRQGVAVDASLVVHDVEWI